MRTRSRRDRSAPRLAAVAVSAALMVAASAGAQSVTWTGTVQGASGSYIFAENTTTGSVANGLSVMAGRFLLTASIPIVYQSTPWISQSGVGMIPTGGPQSGETHGSRQGGGGGGGGVGPGVIRFAMGAAAAVQDTAQFDEIGVGDPTALAAVRLFGDAGGPSLHVTGAAKAPVASVRSGFGTGEWDFGAGAAATAPLGPLTLGLDATKWWLGDMPDLVIRDPVAYGVSVTHYLSGERYAIYGTYWGASKTFDDTDAPRQVGIGGCRMYAGVCALGVTVSAGLSKASPDVAVGMSWQVPLGR